MTLKSLALTAVTVVLLSSGAAFAQTDNTQTNSTGAQDKPVSLFDDKDKMAPFYSDESMTTLKTGEDFTAAFNAMSTEDRQRLRDECQNSTSQRDSFCMGIKEIQ